MWFASCPLYHVVIYLPAVELIPNTNKKPLSAPGHHNPKTKRGK